MNDMSPWEKQLESWTPRPPSARVKQRLFGTPGQRAEAQPTQPAARAHATPVLAWLVPATCLLVLTLSLNVWLARRTGPSYVTAMGGSNMLASLALPSGASVFDFPPDPRSQENLWAVATSGRTTTSHHAVPVFNSFPAWRTNAHF